MSAQVCPVCGGKGLVPNGFYDVSSNLDSVYKTTSATPETCRSCGGKGYIIEYPEYHQVPVYNTFKSCSICNKNDGLCYTSNPPKYRCTSDGEFHTADYCCDRFDDTSVTKTFKTEIITDDEYEESNDEGCLTCVHNDGNLSGYMVTNNSGVYGCIKYRCLLDQKLYSSKHVCDNYKCNQNSDK